MHQRKYFTLRIFINEIFSVEKFPNYGNYYCGPTKDSALIRDPASIFVIMLFPPATKQDQAFIRDWP